MVLTEPAGTPALQRVKYDEVTVVPTFCCKTAKKAKEVRNDPVLFFRRIFKVADVDWPGVQKHWAAVRNAESTDKSLEVQWGKNVEPLAFVQTGNVACADAVTEKNKVKNKKAPVSSLVYVFIITV